MKEPQNQRNRSGFIPRFLPTPGRNEEAVQWLTRIPRSPVAVVLLSLGVHPAWLAALALHWLASDLRGWVDRLGQVFQVIVVLTAAAVVGLVQNAGPTTAWWSGLLVLAGLAGLSLALKHTIDPRERRRMKPFQRWCTSTECVLFPVRVLLVLVAVSWIPGF